MNQTIDLKGTLSEQLSELATHILPMFTDLRGLQIYNSQNNFEALLFILNHIREYVDLPRLNSEYFAEADDAYLLVELMAEVGSTLTSFMWGFQNSNLDRIEDDEIYSDNESDFCDLRTRVDRFLILSARKAALKESRRLNALKN